MSSLADLIQGFAELPFTQQAYYTVIGVTISYVTILFLYFLGQLLLDTLKGKPPPTPLALEEISMYNGTRQHMPRYIVLPDRRVYDVTYFVKEESNLAVLEAALKASKCTKQSQSDPVAASVVLTTGEDGELKPEQLKALEALEAAVVDRCSMAGQLVPSLRLTLEELGEYSGVQNKGRMLLAIQGRIFDVSQSPQFYGPQGFYPFAGREVARAFALSSTEDSDCNDNIADLTKEQMNTLKEWIEKFEVKYPLVGTIVKEH